MTLPLSPPPLSTPTAFVRDPESRGFFDTLLTTVYQLWEEVRGTEFSAKTLTTDATNTAMKRINVLENRSLLIVARVVARRTGGSAGSNGDSAYYEVKGLFKNIGGTVSLVGSVSTLQSEDQAGWNAGFSISGTEVVLTATGAANNNITWQSAVSIYEVGV